MLVAGIGNVFLGDDGFGVEVARRMARDAVPEGVHVADYGIRGIDLAYALMDGWDLAILVDALPHGAEPGALAVIEPDPGRPDPSSLPAVDAHAMHPVSVLRLVEQLGGAPPRLLIVGCQPATFGPEEGHMGLSEPVEAAVDRATQLVASLIERAAGEQEVTAGVPDGRAPDERRTSR